MKKCAKGGVQNINKQASVQKKATPANRNLNKVASAAPRYSKGAAKVKRKM